MTPHSCQIYGAQVAAAFVLQEGIRVLLRVRPNPFIEWTSPGRPGVASHVKLERPLCHFANFPFGSKVAVRVDVCETLHRAATANVAPRNLETGNFGTS